MILRGYKSVACKLLKTNRFHAHPCGKQHESWLNSRNGEVSVARAEGQKGFAVLPHRWVVERTLAWLNQCRRLSKDYEELPTTSETFVYVAMTRLMLKRLAA
jgi:transposase